MIAARVRAAAQQVRPDRTPKCSRCGHLGAQQLLRRMLGRGNNALTYSVRCPDLPIR